MVTMKKFKAIIDKFKIFCSLRNLQTGSVTNPDSMSVVTIVVFWAKSGRVVKLATHLHIMPR
jgi:hypothetical protein